MKVFLTKQKEIEIFLNNHLAKKISELTPIGKGEWSKAFSFRAENTDFVIRFGAFKEDFEKDKLMSQFASVNLPIPKVLEVGQAFGQYFAISERAFGETLEELDKVCMEKITLPIINLLDAIRQVDVSSSVGYGMWHPNKIAEYNSWRDFLLDVQRDEPADRTYGWSTKLLSSPKRYNFFQKTFNLMKVLIDKCPEDRCLIHNDLLHDNVLVLNNKLSAVIDWGNSMYGDFLYELASFSFYESWYSSMNDIDWATEAGRHYEAIGLRVSSFQERLYCYKMRIALDSMAYCSFKERWSDFDMIANRLKILHHL